VFRATYIRIDAAAEALQTEVDTLLLAAAELNFSLFWLINRTLEVEEGYFIDVDVGDECEDPLEEWKSTGKSDTRHFMYIPLGHKDAAELLKSEVIIGSPEGLMEGGLDGYSWSLRNTGGLANEDLRITRNAVFAHRWEIDRRLEPTPLSLDVPSIQEPPGVGADHISKKLSLLNEAATTFWSLADRNDRGTHPINQKVADWFVVHGFSTTQAQNAASLIRPEWVPTGRRPDE